MATHATHAAFLPAEPVLDPRARFRRAIAVRCERADQRYPEGCDLEAEVLADLHDALNGAAAELAGIHSPARWREALRGERTFPLADLCRLAVTPTKEARAAVRAVLARLEHAIEQHLATVGVTLSGRFAELEAAAGHALGDLAKAQEDGKVDATELRQLERDLDVTRAACEDADVLVERQLLQEKGRH